MTSNQFTSLESAISAPATIIVPAPLTQKPHPNSPVITTKIFKKNQFTYELASIDCSKDEHESLKENLRHDQLSRLVKTLLYFESRLKNDQKHIRQMLYEKDKIINQQLNELLSMKKKYNETTALDTPIIADEVSQYCPKCRQSYYMIETKETSMQTNDDAFLFRERKSIMKNCFEITIFVYSVFFF